MALYHFSVRHVSRGKGQMVVASAAYISGQKRLRNRWLHLVQELMSFLQEKKK